jgi:hypothetical protein
VCTIQALTDEVASLSKLEVEEKNAAFASCDQKLARIKEQRKGYNLEMRQLEKEDQRKYQTVSKALPERITYTNGENLVAEKCAETKGTYEEGDIA